MVNDRGKYIEIEEEKMESVRKWAVKRGMVGVSELAKEGNRLIKLTGGKEGGGGGRGGGGGGEEDTNREMNQIM